MQIEGACFWLFRKICLPIGERGGHILRARLQAVKGTDTMDYQHMISVLDILQQLNITKVGLATQESL